MSVSRLGGTPRQALTPSATTSSPPSIPGKYLVESIPALLWLPNFLTPWRKAALKQRARDIRYYTQCVDEVKAKIAAGTAPFSFCKQLLDQQEKTGMSDLEVSLA